MPERIPKTREVRKNEQKTQKYDPKPCLVARIECYIRSQWGTAMRLSRKGAYERFLPWHEGAQEKTQRNDQACGIYCKRIRVADQKRKAVSQEKYYNRYYRPKSQRLVRSVSAAP